MSDPGVTEQFVLLNDQPVGKPDRADILGVAGEAAGLANLILGSRYSAPFTVGIDADWGMGKSTLMLQLQAALDSHEKEGVRTKWFNAWTAQRDDVLAGLIKSALLEVDENLLRRLLRRVAAKRGLLIGLRVMFIAAASFLHLGRVVDQLWDLMSADARSRNEIIGDLEAVFGKWASDTTKIAEGKLLVVFVDDLDRCATEVIMRVCETMRLYLAVPGIVFVIGCDQRVLSRAAQRAGLDSQAASSLGFLEKIIQITYRKPAPDEQQISGLVDHYAEMSRAGRLFSEQAREIIMQGTGRNPRTMKRLLNSIILQYRLDPEWEILGPESLSTVILLAHFHPEFYRELTRPNNRFIIYDFLRYNEVLGLLQGDAELSDHHRQFFKEKGAPQPSADGRDYRDSFSVLDSKLPGFAGLAGQQEFAELLSRLADHPEFDQLMDWLQRRAPAKDPPFVVSAAEASGADETWADQDPAGAAGTGPNLTKPVSLPPRPGLLAGREELLVALHARLTEPGPDAEPRITVLAGLGGVGKTSIAIEYAHRHIPDVDVAWLFRSDSQAVLAGGFAELAEQLQAPDAAAPGDPVASVHGTLAAYPADWLLVFDSAPDRAAVAQFLPPAGRGRVLITSRNPDWPPGQVLTVPVLDTEAGARFLAIRSHDPDGRAAAELATELGGLPLALEQAAAYTAASGGSLADYLLLFRERRPDLLTRGQPATYGSTVEATWSPAFEELERSAPPAAGLLRLLAFCAPEAIPLRLLLQARPGLDGRLPGEVAAVLKPLQEDDLAVRDAVAALRRYSLITPAGDGLISVQRLVQAVTADKMPAGLHAAWRTAAAVLIEAAIPVETGLPDSWPDCAALLPHAETALADGSTGLARLASYLGARGSYAAALDLQQRFVIASERDLGFEHPQTLTGLANLAYWTGRAGNPERARDTYADLLPNLVRVSGPEHPDTLVARDNRALWTGAAGDATGARDQYADLLPTLYRVRGPEHPDTLAARASLARWTGAAGDAADARDQYAALIPVFERILGPRHPSTLAARANLARWTGEAGYAAGARDQYAALLPALSRELGPEHPDTLAARATQANFTGAAGDAVGAHDQYTDLLPVFERVLGDEHPDTLAVRANLAFWTGAVGDVVGARDHYAALLPAYERVLGGQHPDVLATRASLALFTGEAGDAAGARLQYEALLPVYERVLGPEHPSTLTIRNNLASVTGAAGDPAGARDQYAALLPIRERVLGAGHPDTLAARANLVYWTQEAGGGPDR